MADTRPMSKLLQAPTEGYGDAIVIPAILVKNFELKAGLLQLVTSSQFHSFERDDPHAHIRWFNKITSMLKYKNVPHDAIKLMLFPFSLEGGAHIWLEKEPPRSILTWEDLEMFGEAWDRFKELLRKFPHHDFSELHQIDTFYNALTQSDQDSLNAAADGNLLNRTPRDALTIIENKSKVCTSRNKPIVSKVRTTTSSQSPSPDITALTEMVRELVLMNKANQQASVKAVEETCVTCGGPHPYYECLATDSNTFNASAATGSELGSELTFLAGSELRTSELDTSEYRFLKIFILASYEQELCQFNFLLASCQLSSSELRIASYSELSTLFQRVTTSELQSIDEGPFQMGTFQETLAEGNEGALHLGLPKDIYSLINHYTDANDIWDNVKMLLEGSELTKEEHESQLYDDFKHFLQHKGETIHDYYVWFAKLINDMCNIKMTMSRMQLNSKFFNNMLPEWGRFITAVKLNKGLRDSNYDQLYAYLKQHEAHANENKMMLEQFTQPNVDPLALGVDRGPGNNAGWREQRLGGAQNRVWNANPGQDNGVALDEEQLLFIVGGQDNAVDEDVDEQSVQDLALNTMFMANLSSVDLVYDEAGPSYDLDVLSAVHDNDHYQDAICEHHEIHEMHDDVQPNYVVDSHVDYTSDTNMIPYDQYIKENIVPVVQNNVSSVPNDSYLMILNDMHEPPAQYVFVTTHNNVVAKSLTAELATYKEQVELYERRARFELTKREQKIDEQLRIVITDHNIKEDNLEKELHSVKLQLSSTINHNKSMVEEVTSLKKDFKQKENKYLEEFLDMKALKERVEDKLYKQDQSLQTVLMLFQPALYNGHEIIKTNHVSAIMHNSEDTLEIAEITRKKMNDKMKDPECVKRRVKIAPPDYSRENYLATFTPQKQLTPEQIFWSNDLIAMKAEALKEQTKASRPIKALTMYPPNTVTKLTLHHHSTQLGPYFM
ncbi:hypothetical protein Tco_0097338 [Tanacetum coccineum]